MIIFWILASGLIALAILFIVIPLWRSEPQDDTPQQDELNLAVFRQRLQELEDDRTSGDLEPGQYESARRDLERDLLHDLDGQGTAARLHEASTLNRWLLGILLAVAAPALTVALYLHFGTVRIIPILESGDTGREMASDDQGAPSMQEVLQRLLQHVQENPDDTDTWLVLGRTYFAMQQPAQGLDAVEHAYKLEPQRTDVMVAYAQAIAASRPDRSLEGQPAELIDAALQKDPDNVSGRWLSGMLAFQRQHYEQAAAAWQKLLDAMDPESDEARRMEQLIAAAHQKLAEQQGPAPSDSTADSDASSVPPATATPATASEPVSGPDDSTATDPDSSSAQHPAVTLQVAVRLDPSLATQARPDDMVFVFARPVTGQAMPLAIRMLHVRDLPAQVTLDDSTAMMPGMTISSVPQVTLIARISKNGQAIPQSGDLEGQTGPVDVHQAGPLQISIDQVRP